MSDTGGGSLRGRVALVTGGGGGIGGAIALELARRGASVVVNDVAVNVTGTGPADTHSTTTVEAIVAGGGVAVADATSVADGAAVAEMVARTVRDLGHLDIVVNAAGIISSGTLDQLDQEQWDRLVEVHLGGHLNCIRSAVPVMAGQGYGRILNVTSGAGLQRVAGATSAYATAKRAIAALTWALGRRPPAGVTINALSPIAATRMVAGGGAPSGPAGVGRSPAGPPDASPSAPLDLGHLPPPAALAPVVAYLCGDLTGWLSGQVIFTNGVEASVIGAPRLTESVHRSAWLGTGMTPGDVLGDLLIPSARTGATTGGSMPRLAGRPGAPAPEAAGGSTGTCLVVSAGGAAPAALSGALAAGGWRVAGAGEWSPPHEQVAATVPADFDGARAVLAGALDRLGPVDAIVVHSGEPPGAEFPGPAGDPVPLVPVEWDRGIADRIRLHAGWFRAALGAPVGPAGLVVVHVISSSPMGEIVAQAVAQLTRCVQADQDADRFRSFAVEAVEAGEGAYGSLGELVAWLCQAPAAAGLVAEELVAGDGWVGLRGHPSARFTASFGPPVPESWLDASLRAAVASG